MNTDDTDLKFKIGLLGFFDPCKSVSSVLSVVRFGFYAVLNKINPSLNFMRFFKTLRYFVASTFAAHYKS